MNKNSFVRRLVHVSWYDNIACQKSEVRIIKRIFVKLFNFVFRYPTTRRLKKQKYIKIVREALSVWWEMTLSVSVMLHPCKNYQWVSIAFLMYSYRIHYKLNWNSLSRKRWLIPSYTIVSSDLCVNVLTISALHAPTIIFLFKVSPNACEGFIVRQGQTSNWCHSRSKKARATYSKYKT